MDSECRSHVHDLRLSLAMGVRQGRSTAPSQGRPSILGCLVNPSDQGTSVQPAWPPLYPCTQRTDGLRRCGRNPGAFLGSLGPPRGGGHAQGCEVVEAHRPQGQGPQAAPGLCRCSIAAIHGSTSRRKMKMHEIFKLHTEASNYEKQFHGKCVGRAD